MVTREEAVKLYNSNFWKDMTEKEIGLFQLFEDKLCIPFDIFHSALESCLSRPVFTHELANMERLRGEFLGSHSAPTFADILNMIPAEKRILVEVDDGTS